MLDNPKNKLSITLMCNIAKVSRSGFYSFKSQTENKLLRELKDLEDFEHDIEVRDYKDSHREISPLKKADDAIELDTTNLTIDEVVAKITEIIQKKQKN